MKWPAKQHFFGSYPKGVEVPDEQFVGEEHPNRKLPPNTLASRVGLAETLRAQGDLAGARELHERALEGFQRVLGPEHPSTLSSLTSLGNTLRDQGCDLVGARRFHEQALTARRRVLGEEHPDTVSARTNLAVTLRAQGELVGAAKLQEHALGWARRVLVGAEHPYTLKSLDNLVETPGAGSRRSSRTHYWRRDRQAPPRV